MDPLDQPVTAKQLRNALEGDEQIALVRGNRRRDTEERRKSRKSRVSFGGVKREEYGEEFEQITVKDPLQVKDYPVLPSLQLVSSLPPRSSIKYAPKIKPFKELVDKNIQTDDCDLTDNIDSILFQDINLSQIKIGIARNINEGYARRPSRPRGASLVTDSETAPRARRPSEARVENPRLARRNSKAPENTSFLKKVSFYLGKAVEGGKFLQESDSESGSSSSDDWTSESSGSEYYTDERDNTWIESSGTDNEIDEMEMAYDWELENSKQPISNVSPQAAKLVKTTIPFFWLLKFLGRMPFETYVDDGELKFRIRKRGFTFIYFCFTSCFLMFNMTMMALGLIQTSQLGKGQVNLYEQITRRLVDKYFYFAIVSFFYLIHASAWNLAVIFDEGEALAQYLTKFTDTLDTLKYNPFDTVFRRILFQQIWFIVYAIGLTALYIWDILPVVRGTSDLIGLLTFFPFDDEVVFSQAYKFIQIYGFISHLYAVYATHSIVFFAVTYSHVLELIGRIWNLRVAYVFGSLGRPEGDTIVTYHTIIPYEKLFKEHTIIVDFVRETGDAFTVGLGTYYIMKFWELVFIGYHAMSVVIFPIAKFNETIVRKGIPSHLPPFRYADTDAEITASANYLFLQGLAGWYIVSYWFQDCGESIQYGYELVRRHCILLCKSPIQKRFVLSIHNTFAPVSDCYLRMTFTMNKPFIFDFFFWIVTALALLTAFSPQQLKQELVTVCNDNGTCVAIQLPPIFRKTGVSPVADIVAPIVKVTMTTATSTSTTTTTTTTTLAPLPPVVVVIPTTATTPPPPTQFYDCPGNWGGTAYMITLPTACEMDFTPIYPIYDGIRKENCSSEFSGQAYPPIPRPGKKKPLYTCDRTIRGRFGFNSEIIRRDSCGNLQLPIFDGITTYPKLVARNLEVRDSAGTGRIENRFLCCYDYQIPSSKQLEFCNMPSQEAADDLCPRALGTGISSTERTYLLGDFSAAFQTSFRMKEKEVTACLCPDDPRDRPRDADLSRSCPLVVR